MKNINNTIDNVKDLDYKLKVAYENAKKVLNNLVMDVLNNSEEKSLKDLEQEANDKLNVTW